VIEIIIAPAVCGMRFSQTRITPQAAPV